MLTPHLVHCFKGYNMFTCITYSNALPHLPHHDLSLSVKSLPNKNLAQMSLHLQSFSQLAGQEVYLATVTFPPRPARSIFKIFLEGIFSSLVY